MGSATALAAARAAAPMYETVLTGALGWTPAGRSSVPGVAAAEPSPTRRARVRNSICSRKAASTSLSGSRTVRSSIGSGSGVSQSSFTRARDRRIWSAILDQGLAALGLLDLAGPGQQRVEVAIFVDQLGGGLDADAGRARHVVDAVAAQGLNVDDLVRIDAELLEHLLALDAQALHRVEHRDAVADQLHQVLVGRDDDGLAAQLAHAAGIGGDQVVGLVAGQLDGRHAERQRRLAHQRELRDQVLGRRRPMGLVLVVERVAERLLRVIPDHRQVGGRVALHVAQQLPQHVAEALDGAHRQAVALAGQRRQGVIGAEQIGRAVDQEKPDGGAVLGQFGNIGQRGIGDVGHGRQHRGLGLPRKPFGATLWPSADSSLSAAPETLALRARGHEA
jgi:hypothetical protein